MLFGSYKHTLDDKGRLLIPKKIKEELKNSPSLYIMKGFEGCLAIYNQGEFEKLVTECESLSFNKTNNRSYLRVMLASVSELPIDKVGRIQLPSQVLAKFQIGKEVVILGVIDHFEIWDAVKFDKYQQEANDNFENIAESLDRSDD